MQVRFAAPLGGLALLTMVGLMVSSTGQEIDPEVRKQASRAIGLDIGSKMRADKYLDREALKQGFNEGIGRGEDFSPAEQERMEAAVGQFNEQLQTYLLANNLKKANEFLESNRSASGVKALPSGVQYKVIAEGRAEGPKPTRSDIVRVHYTGKLLDGTVFDTSLRGEDAQPAMFQLGQVIDGWQVALSEMKVGDKWQIWIPPSLAYGENPPPRTPIEPNSLLMFEVELLGVEKGPVGPAPR